ncbi:MAG: hypothetical protein ABSH53_09340 [Holophaga sp.]|jgi:hypothetical protein
MVAHPFPKPLKKPRFHPSEPEPELPDQATRHQDAFRKVILGQASDPIFPAPSVPPEVSEEELTLQAMEDRGARMRNRLRPIPLIWRWLFLVVLAVIALTIVLVRRS